MALRIRTDGRILCAALHAVEAGDTYIPDNVSEVLTGCTAEPAMLCTDPEPIHSAHGEWFWVGSYNYERCLGECDER